MASVSCQCLGSCYLCGTSEVELRRCSRCKSALYCSRDHQKEHWKTHKLNCVEPARKGISIRFNHEKMDDETTTNLVSSASLRQRTSDEQFVPIAFSHNTVTALPKLSEDQCHFMNLANKVYDDITKNGYSYIDGFLGDAKSHDVLREVIGMHNAGIMKDGEVISKELLNDDDTRIRNDKIVWVYGKEPCCHHIFYQMTEVDTLIKYLKRRLHEYDIRGRTPAMVACYPGGGSHYVKHVDNPTGDGRCITTLYYLNENWDCEKYGGQLRLYPFAKTSYTDIEPIMDRLLIFWSDKRMPHEVIPAHKIRYAITLWYFDVDERAKATLKYAQGNSSWW